MTWQAQNLAAEEFSVAPPAPDLVGLIYRGERHVISGPPEAMKSMFAFIVAIEEIRAGGKVAILDFELGPAAVRALFVDLGASLEEVASIYYVEPDGPPEPEDIDAMLEESVTLTIIDAAAGAYDVSELDDNARKDAEKFARAWIKPLWKNGVTVILIDHVTKNAETRGRFTIGSERKIGQTRCHLGLEVPEGKQLHRGSDGLVRVRVHKDTRGYLQRGIVTELDLHSDPDTHAITWQFRRQVTSQGADFRPTGLMEKVSRFLEQHGEVPRARIEEAGLGKQGKWVRVAIDTLIEEECAAETPGPRGARLTRSLKPFRDTSSTSSELVSPRPDEDVATSSTSSVPYKGDEVRDEDELLREANHLVRDGDASWA